MATIAPTIDFPELLAVISDQFGISAEQIFSPDRHSAVSMARRVAMYLWSKSSGETLDLVGQRFSRHRSAVMYGIERVELRIPVDPDFAALVVRIARRVGLSPSAVGAPQGIHPHLSVPSLHSEFREAKRFIHIAAHTAHGIVASHIRDIERAIRVNQCQLKLVVTDPRSVHVTNSQFSDALCPGVDTAAEITEVVRSVRDLHRRLIADGTPSGITVHFSPTATPTAMINIDDAFLRVTNYQAGMHSDLVPTFDFEPYSPAFRTYRRGMQMITSRSERIDLNNYGALGL